MTIFYLAILILIPKSLILKKKNVYNEITKNYKTLTVKETNESNNRKLFLKFSNFQEKKIKAYQQKQNRLINLNK